MAVAARAIAAMAIAAIAIALSYASIVRIQAMSTPRPHRAELLEEISRAVVRLHKKYFGQGPTKARTYIGQDVVLCVLQGGLSASERMLLEHGKTGAVITQRQALAETLRQPLIDTVEELTG